MSANRDQTQKFIFLHPAKSPATHPATPKSQVIKAGVAEAQGSFVRVAEYEPTRFLHRPEKPRGAAAIQSLERNLQDLNELHSRLKFMLGELETILKKQS